MAVKVTALIDQVFMQNTGVFYYTMLTTGTVGDEHVDHGPFVPETPFIIHIPEIIAKCKSYAETHMGVTFGPNDKVHLLFPVEIFQ